MAVMDYSQQQRMVIDGTGRILDTTMSNPNVGSWVSEAQLKTWINTGMATDADLTAEVAQREAEDTNLKNALTATNKRVANLEQKAGDEITITYPHVTYGMDEVPPDVAPYAKCKTLIGVSRVNNQQIPSTAIATATMNQVTCTNNGDGSYSLNGTATGGSIAFVSTFTYTFEANKKYLLTGCPSGGGDSTYFLLVWDNGANIDNRADYGNGTIVSKKAGGNPSITLSIAIYIREGTNVTGKVFRPNLKVLDQYFSSDPSVDVSTLTISDIQSDYPELLIPSDYDAGSLVSTTYSGVGSTGLNIWNEQYEVGFIDTSTGANTPANDALRSKDLIPVNAGETLYCYAPNSNTSMKKIRIYFYDANENFISCESLDNLYSGNGYGSGQFDIPSGCAYIRFTTANQSTPVTYNHDIQFVDNSLSTEIKQTYHPYWTPASLPIPSVTLRSAGSVFEVYDLETGKVTHPIGEHIITGNETLNYGTWAENTISLIFPGARPLARGNSKCLTSIYENVTAVVAGGLTYARFVGATSRWANLDDFKADAVGKTIYYELATPSADTYVDPILDPFIQVEGNGTIRPIQTQTIEIDSAMTAEYLSLGA